MGQLDMRRRRRRRRSVDEERSHRDAFSITTCDGPREAAVDADLNLVGVVVVVITLGEESAQRVVVNLDGHRDVVVEVGARFRASVGSGCDATDAATRAGSGSYVWRVQGVGRPEEVAKAPVVIVIFIVR